MIKKRYCFTIDDNIRFLKELTRRKEASLFEHPYTRLLKDLHEKYGVKMQLNLFYQEGDFTLSDMTDCYREEWKNNADWLKLSFHSIKENDCPYAQSTYEEVYRDCQTVQKEILRFAGADSLAKTTTVHYCKTTRAGVKALKDNGVQGLLGLYGTKENPRVSYACTSEEGEKLREGGVVRYDGVAFLGIYAVLNTFTLEQIKTRLERIESPVVSVMIHEQYFYPDYFAYQKDFAEKLQTTFSILAKKGYESKFFEEMIV